MKTWQIVVLILVLAAGYWWLSAAIKKAAAATAKVKPTKDVPGMSNAGPADVSGQTVKAPDDADVYGPTLPNGDLYDQAGYASYGGGGAGDQGPVQTYGGGGYGDQGPV